MLSPTTNTSSSPAEFNAANDQDQAAHFDFNALIKKIREIEKVILSTPVNSRIKRRQSGAGGFAHSSNSVSDHAKLLALLMQTREGNRLGYKFIRNKKQEISKAKAHFDSQRLQMQNIKYEILQVQKEISKCQELEQV